MSAAEGVGEIDADAIIENVTDPQLVERFVHEFLIGLGLIQPDRPAARGIAPQSAGSPAPRDGTEATARGAA